MGENYCRSCYRVISPDEMLCPACEIRTRRGSRMVAALGVVGLPVLLTGIVMLNVRVCVAGAVISGAAAILHVVLTLR